MTIPARFLYGCTRFATVAATVVLAALAQAGCAIDRSQPGRAGTGGTGGGPTATGGSDVAGHSGGTTGGAGGVSGSGGLSGVAGRAGSGGARAGGGRSGSGGARATGGTGAPLDASTDAADAARDASTDRGDAASSDASIAGGSFAPVQAIFTAKCVACHDPSRPPIPDLHSYPQMALTPSTAYAALVGKAATETCGGILVIPGDPAKSYLFHKVADTVPCSGTRMPFGGFLAQAPSLTAAEIAIIEAWIGSGAKP